MGEEDVGVVSVRVDCRGGREGARESDDTAAAMLGTRQSCLWADSTGKMV